VPAFINGGPYHIKLTQVDNSSVGNRDNQIMSGAILPIRDPDPDGAAPDGLQRRRCQPGEQPGPSNANGHHRDVAGKWERHLRDDYATVAPTGSTGTVAFRFYSSQATCTADNGLHRRNPRPGAVRRSTPAASRSPTRWHITTAGVTYWRAHFTGTGLSTDSEQRL
jgi:hypothetical protein